MATEPGGFDLYQCTCTLKRLAFEGHDEALVAIMEKISALPITISLLRSTCNTQIIITNNEVRVEFRLIIHTQITRPCRLRFGTNLIIILRK